MQNRISIEQYRSIARGLNASLTPLTDLKILKEARVYLDIDSTPRGMNGWSERVTLNKQDNQKHCTSQI